ncbi:phosphotransferase [Streptomyces sp. SAJ15]|uniref:phosphotransferase n=1 Tax=Streptomyces sp. SAJ15 TaxID=2011095 RepID=UPI0011853617|nr:phosphotransferase [Streptomyces sp. SAJ15]TVL92448.1 aminoglycoside phosphotransferase [Streptomyces sp. SAJ15]
MPRSHVTLAETTASPDGATLNALLRRYESTLIGELLSCEPLTQGLLNRGYHLTTTRGRFFLKHHLDGDRTALARQHRVTRRLGARGLPVAPPIADVDGATVSVLDGRCYALHPWVEGRHRDGAELSRAQSWRLGALLGLVHTCLEEVIDPRTPAPRDASHAPDVTGADPDHTFALIDQLLALARSRRSRDAFDELAEHRLLERRALLERHAHRRPEASTVPATGWVHGDFHPLNLLYRDAEPAAIVDWDRLGVQPRAEEAVRAAAIFFVRPCGTLELSKVRPYARAYRCAIGAGQDELAAAVHRVWWERLNDFWMLRWHYQLGDHRADPQFPAAAALAVWWTREYDAVREAFVA